MIAPFLAFSAVASVAQPVPAARDDRPNAACVRSLCGVDNLKPVFEKLKAARSRGSPVNIIQIGDSHTAADQITGSWRTLLQSRFGNGGRGVVAPGRPYAGYLTRDVTVTQTGTWTVDGIFGSNYRPSANVAKGLTQYSLTSATPGAGFGLTSDRGETFNQLQVCAAQRASAGVLRLTIGTTQLSWDLAIGPPGPACRTLQSVIPATTAKVELVSGNVTITSWSTSKTQTGGVTLSNLGTVGAQLIHFGRTDDATVAEEFREYAPDLIVVAFGTNEAFKPAFNASDYAASLRRSLARLQQFAPGVPVLVLAAPDSATRSADLKNNAPSAPAPCPSVNSLADPAWGATAALPLVQAIQRQVTLEMGFAYWDWSSRMGGTCASTRWAAQTPPLMRGDRVHFTTPGAAKIAAWLEEDLITAMAQVAGNDGQP